MHATINLAGVDLAIETSPNLAAGLADMLLAAVDAGLHQDDPGPRSLSDGQVHAMSECLRAARQLHLAIASKVRDE